MYCIIPAFMELRVPVTRQESGLRMSRKQDRGIGGLTVEGLGCLNSQVGPDTVSSPGSQGTAGRLAKGETKTA